MKCLSIHLTDLCNSKCSFCVVGSPLYAKDSISYEQVVSFLTENAGRAYDFVNIHGGEATIHPRFFDTLNLIQSLGYPEVHLQTNGIKLANLNFARNTIGLNVRLFIVSLHGDVSEVQDRLTDTRGGFERTVEGIRNVKMLGALVRTNTVVTSENVDRLPQISELAIKLGVDHLNFSNLHPVGSALFGLARMLPTFEEIRAYLYPAINIAVAQRRHVTLEGFPYCSVRERMELQLNNETRGIRMLYRGRVLEDYDVFMNDVMRIFGEPCENCAVRALCGGVYKQYVDLRGWEEFASVDPAMLPVAKES